MLTENQQEKLSEAALQIAEPVMEYLIEVICKAIRGAASCNTPADYAVWKLRQLQVTIPEIEAEVARRCKITAEKARELITQATEASYRDDYSRIMGTPPSQSAVEQIARAAWEMTDGTMQDITQSIGMIGRDGHPLLWRDFYTDESDRIFKQVSTGAQDYNSAIQDVVRNLSEKGVQVVNYESGIHVPAETAIRRNLVSTLGNVMNAIQQRTHDELGCDGWEISAHELSAPDHEPIQGRQYSDEEFERLNNSLKRQIGTLNCQHLKSPIILGVSKPQFTDEELEAMRERNAAGKDFEGKHYSGYECTQQARKMETAIRKVKRSVQASKALGNDKAAEVSSAKLKQMSAAYYRFCRTVGITPQFERTYSVD